MPRYVMRRLLALALGVLCVLPSCDSVPPDLGIYPRPAAGPIGRRTQQPLVAEPADVAVVFIAGFFDQPLAHMRRVYETVPPFPVPGRQFRAFYAWDSCRGSLLAHHTTRLRKDLEAFFAVNPRADLILVGHSYGGSAAMDVVRNLRGPHGRIIVATLDPVSRRGRSMPRVRAAGVDYWVNAYCYPYTTWRDTVPAVGGAWRHCPQADVNLVFDGREKDDDNKHYQHCAPLPLMTDSRNSGGVSVQDLLIRACSELRIGEHE